MFVDICFPNGNEDKFIVVAEQLNLHGLVFIYSDKRKAAETNSGLNCRLTVFCGFFEKKRGVFDEICIINGTKRFGYLADLRVPITQVHIKELAEADLPLILQIGILKNQKRAELANKLSFILDLCNKYKVCVVASSCTNSPFLLLSQVGAGAILKTLGSSKRDYSVVPS
jgi:hypothetical protein